MQMLLYDTLESLLEIKPAWLALQEKHMQHPFQDFSWHYSWWKHIGLPQGLRPLIVLFKDKHAVQMIFPLALHKVENWRIIKWSAYEVSDYCTPLVAEACKAQVGIALRKIIQACKIDSVELTRLRPECALFRILKDDFKWNAMDGDPCPCIDYAVEDFDSWWSGVSTSMRQDRNRKWRRLQKMGEISFRQADSPPAVVAVVEKSLSDKKNWLATRNQQNIMVSQEGRAFLLESLPEMFSRGFVHASALYCGEHSVAQHFGFLTPQRFYYYYPTWDAEFSACSPGRLLLIELIRVSFENHVAVFDFLRGDEAYKFHFNNHVALLQSFDRMSSFGRRLVNRITSLRGTS